MSREAKAKKAASAKAVKNALLKRRIQQAKGFEGVKDNSTSSQEVVHSDDMSDAESSHSFQLDNKDDQDEDYPPLDNDDVMISDSEDSDDEVLCQGAGDAYISPLKELFRKGMFIVLCS